MPPAARCRPSSSRPGVDVERFRPLDDAERAAARRRHGLPVDGSRRARPEPPRAPQGLRHRAAGRRRGWRPSGPMSSSPSPATGATDRAWRASPPTRRRRSASSAGCPTTTCPGSTAVPTCSPCAAATGGPGSSRRASGSSSSRRPPPGSRPSPGAAAGRTRPSSTARPASSSTTSHSTTAALRRLARRRRAPGRHGREGAGPGGVVVHLRLARRAAGDRARRRHDEDAPVALPPVEDPEAVVEDRPTPATAVRGARRPARRRAS